MPGLLLLQRDGSVAGHVLTGGGRPELIVAFFLLCVFCFFNGCKASLARIQCIRCRGMRICDVLCRELSVCDTAQCHC